MGVTGRIRKVTTWLPLEKAQSVRMVTGPVQRHLSLATLHVDAAGRDGEKVDGLSARRSCRRSGA